MAIFMVDGNYSGAQKKIGVPRDTPKFINLNTSGKRFAQVAGGPTTRV